MKRKNRRNCGNKTRSLIRHIKIQYRLLAVFLLISLLPTICIGMYAYRVYTRAINSKISESALQTVRSLNTNMTIELEKFQDYCATLSVADAVQNSLQQCCFSKRMRKLFRKNEKSVLRFCNKSSKTKRAFTKVLMPCKRPF